MRDPTDSIMESIEYRLSGQLKYKDEPFQVFVDLPETLPFNYVFVSDVILSDDSTTDTNCMDGVTVLEVVSGSFSHATNRKAVTTIVDQIMELLVHEDLNTTGFDITVEPYIESMRTEREAMEGRLAIKRIMNIKIKTQEC
jgi:hypothetical protein